MSQQICNMAAERGVWNAQEMEARGEYPTCGGEAEGLGALERRVIEQAGVAGERKTAVANVDAGPRSADLRQRLYIKEVLYGERWRRYTSDAEDRCRTTSKRRHMR